MCLTDANKEAILNLKDGARCLVWGGVGIDRGRDESEMPRYFGHPAVKKEAMPIQWPSLVVVCMRYGAHTIAQELQKCGAPMVLWVRLELFNRPLTEFLVKHLILLTDGLVAHRVMDERTQKELANLLDQECVSDAHHTDAIPRYGLLTQGEDWHEHQRSDPPQATLQAFKRDGGVRAIAMGGLKKLDSKTSSWLIDDTKLQKAHGGLRSCDLDMLPDIKRTVDDTKASQVAVISKGAADLARAVAIEVCREKALLGKFDYVVRVCEDNIDWRAETEKVMNKSNVLLWIDVHNTDVSMSDVIKMLGMEWKPESRQEFEQKLREEDYDDGLEVLNLSEQDMKDLGVKMKDKNSWFEQKRNSSELQFLMELKTFLKKVSESSFNKEVRILLSTDTSGSCIKEFQDKCKPFELEFTCTGTCKNDHMEGADRKCDGIRHGKKACAAAAQMACETCNRMFCDSCRKEVHCIPDNLMATSSMHYEIRLSLVQYDLQNQLVKTSSDLHLHSPSSGSGFGSGAGTGAAVQRARRVSTLEMKDALSMELNAGRPISAMYEDDDGSMMARMCFSDVQFLHKLREQVFVKGLSKITELGFEVDLSHFVEVYEQTTFRLDSMTTHQQEKLQVCIEQLGHGTPVLLRAAAGTGKTFIGIHMLLRELQRDQHSHVLFVAPNIGLAQFIVNWVGQRLDNDSRYQALSRLHVAFSGSMRDAKGEWIKLGAKVAGVGAFKSAAREGLEWNEEEMAWYREVQQRKTLPLNGPYEIDIEHMKSKEKISFNLAAETVKYGIVVVDEAHHIYVSEQNAGVVDGWVNQHWSDADVSTEAQAETTGSTDGPRPTPSLLLLCDMSQSSVENQIMPSAAEVKLTKVVRSSKRIVGAAMHFQTIGEKQETCGQCDISGPPLKPIIFRLPDEQQNNAAAQLDAYATQTAKALKYITGMFPSLCLHDRLAILVPNEAFRAKFVDALREKMEQEPDLKSKTLKLVRASDASSVVSFDQRPGSTREQPWIVVDEMSEFDGLERLFVIAVNMDAKIDDDAAAEARSQLYRAITRAHMMVTVVNEFIPRGWLEFLNHVKFDRAQAFSADKEVERCAQKSPADVAKEQADVALREKTDSAEREATATDSQVEERNTAPEGEQGKRAEAAAALENQVVESETPSVEKQQQQQAAEAVGSEEPLVESQQQQAVVAVVPQKEKEVEPHTLAAEEEEECQGIWDTRELSVSESDGTPAFWPYAPPGAIWIKRLSDFLDGRAADDEWVSQWPVIETMRSTYGPGPHSAKDAIRVVTGFFEEVWFAELALSDRDLVKASDTLGTLRCDWTKEALHHSAKEGDVKVVGLLLNMKADIELNDDEVLTLQHVPM